MLARGPVHEAFAEPVDYNPEPGPVATKPPPEAIDELPPEQIPDGDDVEWIPGYWGWEEETSEYLWVSGFWRDMPPGRRWVPGTWQEAEDGWHWTAGFWAAEEQEAIEYLPPPPQTIDAGPSVRPANETDTYVPGCWVWRETRYFWRPGFFVEYRPDWCWVPARYVWTPGGCIFVDGYWDRPLHLRGMLFSPIRPRLGVAAFVYRPAYVVQTDFLMTAMFVGPARRHYYFGDYFEPAYERRGFVAWINYQPTRRAYDPVFSYYRSTYHSQPTWGQNLTALYAGRRTGDIARPPRTLVQQNTVINNITNNNITNVNVTKNVNITNVQNVTVVRPLTQVNNTEVTALASLAPTGAKEARPAAPRKVVNLTKVNNTTIDQSRDRVKQIRNISNQRQKTEANLIANPPAAGTAKGAERPRPATRMELPKAPARATPPAAAKKGETDPGTPAAPKARRPAPPPPPTVPKQTEREAPTAEGGTPPRTVRPPTGRRDPGTGAPRGKDKDDPTAPKRPMPPMKDKDDDPVRPKTPVRPPVKDKDDDPVRPKTPPARPPIKDKDDDPVRPKAPPVRPPIKDQDDPPARPKTAPMPPTAPPKASPPPKKDKDDDPPPPKKGKGKDKDG